MEKTQGFVLKLLKYGDTSAILYIYTRDFGMKSFMIKGFFGAKKKQLRILQFPLVQVELSFKLNPHADIINLYQVFPVNVFGKIDQNPVKLLIMQFLSEVLHISLKNDEPNKRLYQHLERQLFVFYEKREKFADFHLIFFVKLTSFLGFFPNAENVTLPFFDLQEGKFTAQKNSLFGLNEMDTKLWLKLIQSEFTKDSANQFHRKQREKLLQILLNYYQVHIPGFYTPKSLEIIQEVLR